MLIIIRNIILIIYWPALLLGSIYLSMKERTVYKMVKGSVIGEITGVLVWAMLISMYSLGIITTALLFVEERFIYLVIPVFLVWLISFIWSLKTLNNSQKKASKLFK